MAQRMQRIQAWLAAWVPREALYIAVVTVILALTGIFDAFSERVIIRDVLTLDLVFFFGLLLGTAFLSAARNRGRDWAQVLGTGLLAGLIIAVSLLLLVLVESGVDRQSFRFVFANYQPLIGSVVTFGYSEGQLIFPGLFLLLLAGVALGALGGALVKLPNRVLRVIFLSIAIVLVYGILQIQIQDLFTLPDVLALALAFGLGYGIARYFQPEQLPLRLLLGAASGAILGILLAVLIGLGALDDGGILRGLGDDPVILGGSTQPLIALTLTLALVGVLGALATVALPLIHDGLFYLLMVLVGLGILNIAGRLTVSAALILLVLVGVMLWYVPVLGRSALQRFELAPQPQRNNVNRLSGAFALALVLIAPVFMGQYITNVLDLVMLYIIMGIGLNVMVGFAGLLDLGYVASFAIGAYTAAILTTPSVITTGCLGDAVQSYEYFDMCVGIAENWGGIGVLTFWQAWPLAVLVSAFTGMALGVPVLGLRGDYLAIVTLAFGEITAVLTRSRDMRPLLGAAQGISPVPVPVLDLSFLNPDWVFEFNTATSIYYLYVFAVLIAAFVVIRLAGARLGRAWRAMKADEDVAEAMGVRLITTKLLAFGISSAFAGLGGAVFAAQLRGIFPDSFTVMVSINVLSLIIIGGLGSIPGVFLGALVLVGLPEVLRELQDYRLLVFGAVLVMAMLLRPQGLLPPRTPKLSERSSRKKAEDDDNADAPATGVAVQGGD